MKRGQIWTVTDIVSEYTTRTSKAKGFRIMVRFADDAFQIGGAEVATDTVPTATSSPEESATPTLIPEDTNTPQP